MSTQSQTITYSFPVFSIAFIIMFVLKLAGVQPVADWSWWIITAPLWAGFAIVLGVFAIIFILLILAAIVAATLSK